MIRTGKGYTESIRYDRQVWMNGERVDDVTTHPAFKPLVGVRARIYDKAHEKGHQDMMSYVEEESGERSAVAVKLPHTQRDWQDKRLAVAAVYDNFDFSWPLDFVKHAAGLSDRIMGEKKKEKAA